MDTDLDVISVDPYDPQALRFVMPAMILSMLSTPIFLTKVDIDFSGSSVKPCANSTTSPPSPILVTRMVISLNDHRGNVKYVDHSFNASDNPMTTVTLGFPHWMKISSSDQVVNFYFFHSDCNQSQNLVVIPKIVFHYLPTIQPQPQPQPQPPYPFPTLAPVEPSQTPNTSNTPTAAPSQNTTVYGFILICFVILLALILLIQWK